MNRKPLRSAEGAVESKSLREKTVLLSDGVSEAGIALASAMSNRGAVVVIFGSGEARLRHAVKEIQAYGKVAALSADPRRSEDVARVVDVVIAKFGRLDILLNFVRSYPVARRKTQLAETAPVSSNCIQAALPLMDADSSILTYLVEDLGFDGRALHAAQDTREAVRKSVTSLKASMADHGPHVMLAEGGKIMAPKAHERPCTPNSWGCLLYEEAAEVICDCLEHPEQASAAVRYT